MDSMECNFCLMLDKDLTLEFESLKPHKSVFSLNSPRQVSSNLSMSKPVVSSISDFIESSETPDPVKLALMEELFID
jgi:hypothetical protein